jgi:hypothetical protein
VLVERAGHTWAFWNYQLGPVFDAMEGVFRDGRPRPD